MKSKIKKTVPIIIATLAILVIASGLYLLLFQETTESKMSAYYKQDDCVQLSGSANLNDSKGDQIDEKTYSKINCYYSKGEYAKALEGVNILIVYYKDSKNSSEMKKIESIRSNIVDAQSIADQNKNNKSEKKVDEGPVL